MILSIICFTLSCEYAVADISAIELILQMLHPANRFNLQHYNESSQHWESNEYKGYCSSMNGNTTFIISGLVDNYNLLIESHASGENKIGLIPLNTYFDISSYKKIDVLQDDIANYNKTQLISENGLPRNIFINVYWNLNDKKEMGYDVVKYKITYRTEKDGDIKIVNCRHDLRGTPLEAPKEAASYVAIGAIHDKLDLIRQSLMELSLHEKELINQSEEKSSPWHTLLWHIDNNILKIIELREYAGYANPYILGLSELKSEGTKRLAGSMINIRKYTVNKSNYSKEIDAILKDWSKNGIKIDCPEKSY